MNERLATSAVVEALERSGAMDAEDLYRWIQKLLSDLDRRAFGELLMALEIQGLIRVYGSSKEKRRVELVQG